MSYSIHELANMAGISVRTLHYYDDIGLLDADRDVRNKYRVYKDGDLLKLQQILFFRELGFKLGEIKMSVDSPDFDLRIALKDHRKMIFLKRKGLDGLIVTIDRTIKKISSTNNMEDEKLYDSFSTGEIEEYKKEAKQKWGNTKSYKQFTERVKKMGKRGLSKAMEESAKITDDLARCMNKGFDAESEVVQRLIRQHYNWLKHFYEPSIELYLGLAKMYLEDERFKANYEKVAKGLAQFVHDAMVVFVGDNR